MRQYAVCGCRLRQVCTVVTDLSNLSRLTAEPSLYIHIPPTMEPPPLVARPTQASFDDEGDWFDRKDLPEGQSVRREKGLRALEQAQTGLGSALSDRLRQNASPNKTGTFLTLSDNLLSEEGRKGVLELMGYGADCAHRRFNPPTLTVSKPDTATVVISASYTGDVKRAVSSTNGGAETVVSPSLPERNSTPPISMTGFGLDDTARGAHASHLEMADSAERLRFVGSQGRRHRLWL